MLVIIKNILFFVIYLRVSVEMGSLYFFSIDQKGFLNSKVGFWSLDCFGSFWFGLWTSLVKMSGKALSKCEREMTLDLNSSRRNWRGASNVNLAVSGFRLKGFSLASYNPSKCHLKMGVFEFPFVSCLYLFVSYVPYLYPQQSHLSQLTIIPCREHRIPSALRS